MAKTQWADGEHLTPAQMILFFGDDAVTGHSHDGTDVDGDCPKIPATSLSDFETGTFDLTMRAADVKDASPSSKTWTYFKINKLVMLFIAESVELSNSTECQFEVDEAAWPNAIVPTYTQKIPVAVANATGYSSILSPGLIVIPASGTANMTLWVMDSAEGQANVMENDNFSALNTVYKGLPAQSISYYVH